MLLALGDSWGDCYETVSSVLNSDEFFDYLGDEASVSFYSR